ncbi:GNAT family N-acetyltransferase [Streptomyces misionensis]|uniref:GNAT family N-acetyltransferase n=1 Tax=Streptomyces misionensis TaxID=67331 RepID=UPI001644CEF4
MSLRTKRDHRGTSQQTPAPLQRNRVAEPIKTECIRSRVFAARAEANLARFEYIDGFHDPRRIQKRLGYLSPIEYEDMPGATTTAGELYALCVAPSRPGSGVRRVLLDAAHAHALDRGSDRLLLWVLTGDAPARCLHERVGYVTDGAVRTEDHDGVPVAGFRYCRDSDCFPGRMRIRIYLPGRTGSTTEGMRCDRTGMRHQGSSGGAEPGDRRGGRGGVTV